MPPPPERLRKLSSSPPRFWQPLHHSDAPTTGAAAEYADGKLPRQSQHPADAAEGLCKAAMLLHAASVGDTNCHVNIKNYAGCNLLNISNSNNSNNNSNKSNNSSKSATE